MIPGCTFVCRTCLTPQVRVPGDSVACSAGWGRHLSLLAASVSRRERDGPVRHKTFGPSSRCSGLLRPLL